jgi:putative transposase
VGHTRSGAGHPQGVPLREMAVPYDRERHHRRSIRLRNYEYAQSGAYFVTICVQNHLCLFGDVVDGEMRWNDAGRMIKTIWQRLPKRFPVIEPDASIVMPNHFHAIVLVGAPLVGALDARAVVGDPDEANAARGRAPTRGAPTSPALGDIIGAFKSLTTTEYARGIHERDWPPFQGRLWQRNYYEHVIRDDDALNRIREYILTNPLGWTLDRENPERRGEDEFDRWLASFEAPKRERRASAPP